MNAYKIVSYQVADFIDIKAINAVIDGKLLYKDSAELFYQVRTDHYLYIFKHGNVSFFNYQPDEIASFFELLNRYCKNFFSESFSDELLVETNAPQNKIGHNKIEIENENAEILRMIMLNVSQSVTLDYYSS